MDEPPCARREAGNGAPVPSTSSSAASDSEKSATGMAFGGAEAPSAAQPPLPPTPPPTPPPASPPIRSSASVGNAGCVSLFNGRAKFRDDKLSVQREHMDVWDALFAEAYDADVTIATDDGGLISAHSIILAATSPVLRAALETGVSGPRKVAIRGVPHSAARAFVRFLYCSRYRNEDMEQFIVHLLILSHAYCVPSLKRLCTYHFERGILSTENVVDVLQMARLCDAPRLHLLCHRMVLKSFQTVARTDGWRVMRASNAALEQELVEAVVEADNRRQKIRSMKNDRDYEHLHEIMEALVHICRDGCQTIGRHDTPLDPTKQRPCSYPACKGLEGLVRHFATCQVKVSGGCAHCKRMWQLLELHSQMCRDISCRVPLCGHFRNKIGQLHSKQYGMRWKRLVKKVQSAKTSTCTGAAGG